MNFRCADTGLVGPLSIRQIVTVYPAAKKNLARRTGVVESGGARKNGLSTDLDEEMYEPARKKAALSSGPAEIGA